MASKWKAAAHGHGEQNECGHFSCLLVLLLAVPFPITVMLRLICTAVMPTGPHSQAPHNKRVKNLSYGYGLQFGVFYFTASSSYHIIPAQQETQTQFLIQENGWEISALVGKINTDVGYRFSTTPTHVQLGGTGIIAQVNNT